MEEIKPKAESIRIAISLFPEELAKLDRLVKLHGTKSRSNHIRELVRVSVEPRGK